MDISTGYVIWTKGYPFTKAPSLKYINLPIFSKTWFHLYGPPFQGSLAPFVLWHQSSMCWPSYSSGATIGSSKKLSGLGKVKVVRFTRSLYYHVDGWTKLSVSLHRGLIWSFRIAWTCSGALFLGVNNLSKKCHFWYSFFNFHKMNPLQLSATEYPLLSQLFGSKMLLCSCSRHQKLDYNCSIYPGNEAQISKIGHF